MNGTAALKSSDLATAGNIMRGNPPVSANLIKSSVEDATGFKRSGSAGGLAERNPSSRSGGLKVINLPVFSRSPAASGEFFAATQEWEGVITEIFSDYFTAELRDVTAGDSEVSEVAEIPFDAVSPDDRSKVIEGLIFRWLVGYSKTKSLQYSKKQVIYLRPVQPNLKVRKSLHSTAASLRSKISDLPKIEI